MLEGGAGCCGVEAQGGCTAEPATHLRLAQGSTGFREAVQQNLRWFEGARLVLISNTLWVGERLPCITCEWGGQGLLGLGLGLGWDGRCLVLSEGSNTWAACIAFTHGCLPC